MQILHIIERLTLGGPLFATAGLAKDTTIRGSVHRLVSLLPADARAVSVATIAGIDVIAAPTSRMLTALVQDADILQLHFWNSPAIHEFLNQGIRPCRLIVWSHINGMYPPHVIPADLIRQANCLAATTALTLDLPQIVANSSDGASRFVTIPGGADFSRLAGFRPHPDGHFNVGFVGHLDASKTHPEFIELCSRILQDPKTRIIVRGYGAHADQLKRKASDLGIFERFIFEGGYTDIRQALSDLSILGYPLHPRNHCTSELVVQEAMYAGIPPVLLPFGGPARLVTNGRNGIVASNTDEYVAAVRTLAKQPDLRSRLGDQARLDARAQFGSKHSAAKMDSVYDHLIRQPKGVIQPITGGRLRKTPSARGIGAQALICSLDGHGSDDMEISLSDATSNEERTLAEIRIGKCDAAFQDMILQYRIFYPLDRHLRLWSGLILADRKRWALASGELRRAKDMGCGIRVDRYLARVAKGLPVHD